MVYRVAVVPPPAEERAIVELVKRLTVVIGVVKRLTVVIGEERAVELSNTSDDIEAITETTALADRLRAEALRRG